MVWERNNKHFLWVWHQHKSGHLPVENSLEGNRNKQTNKKNHAVSYINIYSLITSAMKSDKIM